MRRLTLIFLLSFRLLAQISVVGGINAATTLSNGLVGRWELNECGTAITAIDSSGGGNNGTWHGTKRTSSTPGNQQSPLGYYDTGPQGQCAGFFDGTSNYIDIPVSLNSNYMSVAVRVNLTGGTSTVAGNQNLAAPYAQWGITVNPPGVSVVVNGTQYQFNMTGSSLQQGVWYWLAWTYDGTTIRTYLDGVPGATQAVTGTLSASSSHIQIGQATNFPGRNFAGDISSLWVHNRALAADEELAIARSSRLAGANWQSAGVWNLLGTVATGTGGVWQPEVFYLSSGCRLVASPCFVMLYSNFTTGGLFYQEAPGGADPGPGTWTADPGNPIVPNVNFIRVYGPVAGTYYLYASTVNSIVGPIGAYTSTDLHAWTQQRSSAFTAGVSPAWNSHDIAQFSVAGQFSGTWYGYLCGSYNDPTYGDQWSDGAYTSANLLDWSPVAGQPQLNFAGFTGQFFETVGSTIYAWGQFNPWRYGNTQLPTDIMRMQTSTSTPGGPWVPSQPAGIFPTIWRWWVQGGGGAGPYAGQVADPFIIAANGNLYFFQSTDINGNSATSVIEVEKAAGMTFAQLVAGAEGMSGYVPTWP